MVKDYSKIEARLRKLRILAERSSNQNEANAAKILYNQILEKIKSLNSNLYKRIVDTLGGEFNLDITFNEPVTPRMRNTYYKSTGDNRGRMLDIKV